MRKWIAVIIVFILVLGSVYWLVPGKITVHQKLVVPVNAKAFAREISNEEKWKLWWPGKQINQKESEGNFEYNGNTYILAEKRLSSVVINIAKGKDSLSTELIFVPLREDSVELTWSGMEKKNSNPVDRIQNLSWSKKINSDIEFLLQKINAFYSDENSLYGFQIQKDFVADSNFIFTSLTSKTYPDVPVIYTMIDKLKNYIQKNGAKETGYPMLNIYKNTDGYYLARVAFPVDKKLNDYGDIQYKWMLKGGNILVTEVKGGPAQIEKAFEAVAYYVEDHRRVAPAIPFQSLITDRRQEPDTNKWITKVYWPVM